MHLAAAVNMGCVPEYMCDGAQHAWLHACVQRRDAVSAGGAHHHKAPLLHNMHCLVEDFGPLICNDFSGSIANQCARLSCISFPEMHSSGTLLLGLHTRACVTSLVEVEHCNATILMFNICALMA